MAADAPRFRIEEKVMASRRAPGGRLSKHIFAIEAPRRRVLAAFALGAAITVAGLAALAAGGASARGLFLGAYGGREAAQPAAFTLLPLDPQASEGRRKHRHSHVAYAKQHEKLARFSQHEAVCVRLCDGYFFPLPSAAAGADAQTASCNSLCPDAPTDVYYRSGSDNIGDSVNAAGRLYSALPVALRYRSSADSTCSCHRSAVAYAPLDDATLRQGDLIMTPAGFVMFRGAEGAKHHSRDFTALAKTSVPAAMRGDLTAMERVSMASDHPTLRHWLASQATPAFAARKPERRIERVATSATSRDDRIRLLVWRGAAQD
jgi:hypothetical protein